MSCEMQDHTVRREVYHYDKKVTGSEWVNSLPSPSCHVLAIRPLMNQLQLKTMFSHYLHKNLLHHTTETFNALSTLFVS